MAGSGVRGLEWRGQECRLSMSLAGAEAPFFLTWAVWLKPYPDTNLASRRAARLWISPIREGRVRRTPGHVLWNAISRRPCLLPPLQRTQGWGTLCPVGVQETQIQGLATRLWISPISEGRVRRTPRHVLWNAISRRPCLLPPLQRTQGWGTLCPGGSSGDPNVKAFLRSG